MKTVKDFKDAGLEFIEGDVIGGETFKSYDCIMANTCANHDHSAVNSFCWRVGLPDDYEGKYETVCVGSVLLVPKWRPLLIKREEGAPELIYTQEMADKGELPVVDMKCLFAYSAFSDFEEVEVLFSNDEVTFIKHGDNVNYSSFSNKDKNLRFAPLKSDDEILREEITKCLTLNTFIKESEVNCCATELLGSDKFTITLNKE